jgi:NADH dehydrogenase
MLKILVLGGGFGGVRAALDLSKRVKGEITLVNSTHFHCYIPELYDVATAFLKNPQQKDLKRLKGSVDIHLEDIFKGTRVKVLVDRVEGIDLEKRSVRLANGELEYDYLVVALGSSSNYFGIKGAEEFSHPLKDAYDALNVRNDLDEMVKGAEGRTLEVVIAGGGFTGVELAGAMGRLVEGVGKITVVEATGEVLGGMPKWAREDALRCLKKQKVEVKLNCPIKEVKAHTMVADDGEVPFDYLIWTAGVKGIELKNGIKGVELGKKGQLQVLKDLSLEKYPEVFVAGDMAEFENGDKGYVPAAAWAAIAEAKTAARNVECRIKNLKLSNFNPPKSVFIVPIGDRFALSNAFGMRFKGIIGWVLKQGATLRYLFSIMPISEAIKLWGQEVEVDILEH